MRALSFHDLEEEKGIPCSRQHIDRLIKQNRFPRPFKLGGIPGSANAWDDDEIDQHLEDLKHAAARKPAEPQRCIVRYLLCEASECRAFEDSAQTLRSRRQIVDFLAWMAEYEGCDGRCRLSIGSAT
jgi:predicted DNA-binding transcriptional regulator AlpA